MMRPPALPDTIASGNGRIEADEIQIATKYPGRVKEILVEEGDMVAPGAVLAHMDTDELNAQIQQAEAEIRRLENSAKQARAAQAQAESQLRLAEKELERELVLFGKGHTSQERVDLRRTEKETLAAALNQAQANVSAVDEGVNAARAALERLQTMQRDMALKSSRGGRVLYRLAEEGEVLPAGGRLLPILDVSSVYMTIFLPAEKAGPLAIGADARIILDPLPQYVIPAKVTFVSPQAQFTPRQVETADEREKLMFRVKVKIPSELLRQHLDRVKTGVRGVAYVRLDDETDWPAHLAVKLPNAPAAGDQDLAADRP